MSDDTPHKYFTAGEAAALAKEHGILDVPTTKSGMIKWIKRHEADYVNSFSRKREGQKGGGGTEYSWAFFPEPLWEILDAEVERRRILSPDYVPPKAALSLKDLRKKRQERPPDFSAPTGWWAASLAASAGLEQLPLIFSDFIIRKVNRCLVRFDNKKYFSRKLNGYHEKEVVITASDEYPDRSRPSEWCSWIS